MVTRHSQVAVLVTDADDRLLHQLDADPQARQLLGWFETLSADDRADVHALARRRHAGHARPSFQVLAFEPRD